MSDTPKPEASLYYNIMADLGIAVDQSDPELLEKAEKHFLRLIGLVDETMPPPQHNESLSVGVRDLAMAQSMWYQGRSIHNSNSSFEPTRVSITNLLKRGLLRSRRNTTLPFTIKDITSDVPTPKEKQVLLPRGTFFKRTVRINGKVHKYLYRKLSASEKERHAATLRERHIAIGPKPTKLETHRSVEPPTRPLVQSVPPTRVELNETKSLSPRLHSKPLDSAPSTKAIIHAQDPKKESNLPPGAFERHLTVNGQTVTFVDRPAIPAEERAHTREILVRVGATQPRLAHRFTQKRVRNALKVNPHKDNSSLS